MDLQRQLDQLARAHVESDARWEKRMNDAEKRMADHDRRMAEHDQRMAALDRRMARSDAKWDKRMAESEAKWEKRMTDFDKKLQATRRLVETGMRFVLENDQAIKGLTRSKREDRDRIQRLERLME